jgi:hypothetical protein
MRRLCVAFDLEKYSSGNDVAQIEKQRALAAMVRDASEHGALGCEAWLRQAQGDGELALLPPGINEGDVITGLWREFRKGLHRYNRHVRDAARLRLRVAIHEGMAYAADNGFAGAAVNTVCRLRDCAEAKDALRGSDSDLILIVSDRIFDDVIRGYDDDELPAAEFRAALIDIPDKGFTAAAFIFADGDRRMRGPREASGGTTGANASPPSCESRGHAGTSISIGPNSSIRDIAETINHIR